MQNITLIIEAQAWIGRTLYCLEECRVTTFTAAAVEPSSRLANIAAAFVGTDGRHYPIVQVFENMEAALDIACRRVETQLENIEIRQKALEQEKRELEAARLTLFAQRSEEMKRKTQAHRAEIAERRARLEPCHSCGKPRDPELVCLECGAVPEAIARE